jgi:hypothetical protein
VFEAFFKKFCSIHKTEIFKRTVLRSAWLISMTLMAGLCLELLVQASRFGGGDLANKFPELLVIFRAVSIMTWLEVSILWIRLAVSPKMDLQAMANRLMETDHGAKVVYLVNIGLYVLRFLALLVLCEFV